MLTPCCSGNVQGELQVASSQTDYDESACNIWLCKGYKFEDNSANVQTYTAGQVVPFKVEIRAPHTGVANVSIVDTATNSVIGQPLISWDDYASNSHTIPDDQTSFDITIPSDIGSQCATAGDCVIQWYWNAASIDQTYESCVDFTVGGSSSGSSSGSTTAKATTTAAASTASAVASQTATPTSIQVQATPTSSAAATSTALPETFTLDTFIDWLKASAGSSNTKRHARSHARQIRPY